jgi:hypothetical protein
MMCRWHAKVAMCERARRHSMNALAYLGMGCWIQVMLTYAKFKHGAKAQVRERVPFLASSVL